MSKLAEAVKEIRARRHKLIADINNLLSEFTDETGVVVTGIDICAIRDSAGQQHMGYVASIKAEV